MIDAQIKLAEAKRLQESILGIRLKISELCMAIPDYHFGLEDNRSIQCKKDKNHVDCGNFPENQNCNCICHGAKKSLQGNEMI
jgi:hypothetical protein